MPFLGVLKPFQVEDVEKLKTKRSRLIGNEPGTGKTYEAIALDQLNRDGDGNPKVDLEELFLSGRKRIGKKTLIVCPKSVISSWDEHLTELTKDNIYIVDTKNRQKIVTALLDPSLDGYFVVNWEFLRTERKAIQQSQVFFFHVIADECHRAKSRKSQQTQGLKSLATVYKTAMSGTPADNKPQDLWSILNWLWPNYYTAFWSFVNTYVLVSDEEKVEYTVNADGSKGRSVTGYKKLHEPNPATIPDLREEMSPWYTRRLKKDVLPDLPDKYYSRVWVDLDPKQRRAYDQMRKTMMVWIEDMKDKHGEDALMDPIIANATVSQLVRLQQYACGYLIPRLDELGNQVYKRSHRHSKMHIEKRLPCPHRDVSLGELMGLDEPPCNDVAQYDVVDPSSKLDTVEELISDREGQQIIVWSQFKGVINLLAERLQAKDMPYGLLTGDTSQAERDRDILAFQTGELPLLIGTIKTGGTGLNLQNSSTAMFIDRVWSPGDNTQAEDRQHRIGQKSAVEIIDIMARNTVDLGKATQLHKKMQWLQMLLGDAVSTDDLIVQLNMEAKV